MYELLPESGIDRRKFLKGSIAFGGFALVVGTLMPATARPDDAPLIALPADEQWIYDVPLGIMRNPKLTERLRRRAGWRALRRWKQGPMLKPGAPFKEYGNCFEVHAALQNDSWYEESMIYQLAHMCRQGLRWSQLPEVRAGIPFDLGRTRSVAWYGIAHA